MTFLKLNSGAHMPALGLGTWRAEPGVVGDAVREAIRIGYRHIDCAAIYQNEKEIGSALSAAIADGDVKREDLWITSKLWNCNHLEDDVRPALENTLKDLQLEFLDLYLVHWPVAHKPGVVMPESVDDFLSPRQAPMEETWRAMEACRERGLTRHIGVSNFSARKIDAMLDYASIRPSVNQVEGHPYLAQTELLGWCKRNHVVVTAYSPLGSPDRPEMLQVKGEPTLLDDPRVAHIAEAYEATPGQVLIAWGLKRGTAVIPKSSNPERLKQNFAAAKLQLDDGDMQTLDSMDRGFRFIDGSFWTAEGSPYTLADLWDE